MTGSNKWIQFTAGFREQGILDSRKKGYDSDPSSLQMWSTNYQQNHWKKSKLPYRRHCNFIKIRSKSQRRVIIVRLGFENTSLEYSLSQWDFSSDQFTQFHNHELSIHSRNAQDITTWYMSCKRWSTLLIKNLNDPYHQKNVHPHGLGSRVASRSVFQGHWVVLMPCEYEQISPWGQYANPWKCQRCKKHGVPQDERRPEFVSNFLRQHNASSDEHFRCGSNLLLQWNL